MEIDANKARLSYLKLPRGPAYTPLAIVQDELLLRAQHYINARKLFGRDATLALRHLSTIYSLCRVKRQMMQALS